MGKWFLLTISGLPERTGLPGLIRQTAKAAFKTSRVLKATLFAGVFCLAAADTLWTHPHANPADEHSAGFQVFGGNLKIGGSLRVRFQAETDTRKNNADEEAPTTVFFNESEDPFPMLKHAGHGGSAPSAGSGSNAEDDLSDGTGLRADLSAVFSRDEGGMKLTFRKNMSSLFDDIDTNGKPVMEKETNYFDLLNAYGWLNLWKGMITVTAGIIDDGLFGTAALEDTPTDSNYDAVRGLRLAVTPFPVPGLLVGAAWDFGTYLGSSDTAWIFGNPDYVAAADANRKFDSLGSFFSRTIAGVLYMNDRFGGMSVSVKPKGIYYDSVISPEKSLNHGADLLFGVKVTALRDFLFIFDGEVRSIGIDSSFLKAAAPIVSGMNPGISEAGKKYAAAYMPGFDLFLSGSCTYFYGLTLGARYHLQNLNEVGDAVYDEEAAYMSQDVRLSGSYEFFPWMSVGLETQFDFDGITRHEMLNHKTEDRDSIFKGFYLRPGVTFTISEGISFTIRDKLYIFNERYIANPYDKGGYLLNQVQLDFTWNF